MATSSVRRMNRTDRLYAIVEELRAVAPRPRSARWLAERFEVSVRTIERDLSALQQTGTAIYAEPGRRGGYVLDAAMTLPPVNFTSAEAAALAVALSRAGEATPFPQAARTAMHKVLATMPAAAAQEAHELTRRVQLLQPDKARVTALRRAVPAVVEQAIVDGRALRMSYEDREASVTARDVEPVAFVRGTSCWYLLAWCRLRGEARCFRVDRIRSAQVLDDRIDRRPLEAVLPLDPRVQLQAAGLD